MFEPSDMQDIGALLPHAGPMLLLDRVVEAEGKRICCEATVRSDGLFDRAGAVPAYLGLEYMAQAIAALSGLHARQRGEPARLGFLLGTRRFETSAATLHCGAIVQVIVREVVRSTTGMAAFDCQVTGKDVSQSARLSVFEPGDPDHYLQGDIQ